MPFKVRSLAENDDDLVFSEVKNVDAIFHEPTETHESVTKFFAPKSYVAGSEFKNRKEKQRLCKIWMNDIIEKKTQMQLNQLKLHETMLKNRNQNGNSGMGM